MLMSGIWPVFTNYIPDIDLAIFRTSREGGQGYLIRKSSLSISHVRQSTIWSSRAKSFTVFQEKTFSAILGANMGPIIGLGPTFRRLLSCKLFPYPYPLLNMEYTKKQIGIVFQRQCAWKSPKSLKWADLARWAWFWARNRNLNIAMWIF